MVGDVSSSDQKLSAALGRYVEAPGIAFDDSVAEARYRERVEMVRDTLMLKPSKRVPVTPLVSGFPLHYSGFHWKDGLYRVDRLCQAIVEYYRAFQPDVYSGPRNYAPGNMFDLLQYTLYDWPGQNLAEDVSYQMNEGEYMEAADYPGLIADPTGFLLRTYLPRIYPVLEPLKAIPNPLHHVEMPRAPSWFLPFATPELQKTFELMKTAGEMAMAFQQKIDELDRKIQAMGFPRMVGASSTAPFDILGDTLRGTKEIFLDIYRRPDQVIEACNRLVPMAISLAVDGVAVTGVPMCFFPLHKGSDGFMSDEQFRTFYWPSLKAVMLGLVQEGIVPVMFAEGEYNDRLEVIADFPRAKCLWLFDRTDIKRAKDILGDVCCIAGNVPISLLTMGSPDQVAHYCKDILEYCGRGGGFWLTNGASFDQARPENVRAMIAAAGKYGGS